MCLLDIMMVLNNYYYLVLENIMPFLIELVTKNWYYIYFFLQLCIKIDSDDGFDSRKNV